MRSNKTCFSTFQSNMSVHKKTRKMKKIRMLKAKLQLLLVAGNKLKKAVLKQQLVGQANLNLYLILISVNLNKLKFVKVPK